MRTVIFLICIILKLQTLICAEEKELQTCDSEYRAACKSWLQMSKIEGNVSKRKQVAALGRVARLGDLYDANSDQFMEISLYKSDLPNDAVSSVDKSHSSINYVKTESLFEKFQKLGVQAPLSISFLGGLVNVSGSGDYLHQDMKSAKSAKASLVYRVKTIREDLEIFFNSSKNVIDTTLLKNVDATHVVVGIDWGANVVLSIEEKNTDLKHYKDVQRKLEDTLDKIMLSVTNSSHIDREKFDVEESSTFNLTLNADILPDAIPQTIEESIAYIKDIPNLIKSQNEGKGTIVNYILMTVKGVREIFNVKSNITAIVSEIDSEKMCRFVKIFQEIKDSKILIKDVHDSFNDSNLMVLEEEFAEIVDYKLTFFSFANMYRRRFANFVFNFRRGAFYGYDEPVSLVVSEYERSDYTLARVKKFLDGFKPAMHKIELLNLFQSFNVSFIDSETKNEITKESRMSDMLFSADLSKVSSPLVNDLIKLAKTEFKKQVRTTKFYTEDVPVEVSGMRVYFEITKTLSCDEKLSPCLNNITESEKSEKTDKKEYIFLKDYKGKVMILEGNTFKTIREYNMSEVGLNLVAIVDDTFYMIDTMEGIIEGTALENIMNGSDAVFWTRVSSFSSETSSIVNGVTVNNSFIYFVTHTGVLYSFDTSLKTVTKMGAVGSAGSYASLVIVNGILYIHKEDKFLSFDGAVIEEITTPEQREQCGLFRFGSLVCRVGGSSFVIINSDPVSCYDPKDETWTVTSYINQYRWAPSITSAESGTYVFGGWAHNNSFDFYSINSVEVFNPKTKIWKSIPSPISNKHLYVQAVTFYF